MTRNGSWPAGHWTSYEKSMTRNGSWSAKKLERVREEHKLEIDALVTERQRYRIQSFALAKEADLIAAQIREISAERDRHLVERDSTRAERDGYRVELEAVRESVRNLTVEQEQLHARLNAQVGLRYLVKATLKALRRRSISAIRSFVRKPARLVKPYLPAPVLSLARSIARRLRL